MRLLLAVADDLFSFAYDSIRAIFGFLRDPEKHVELRAFPEMHDATHQLAERTAVHAMVPIADVIATKNYDQSSVHFQKNTVMYTSSIATPLLRAPYAKEDAVLTALSYGSMVMVLEARAPYARVVCGPSEGWVHMDDLTDRAANVYPQFIIGEANLAEDVSTERVRAMIDDEFGAGDIGMPLQAEEYVLYRLVKKGTRIAWPPIRPRSPGTWHSILEHVPGVRISEKPAAGSVMELSYGENMTPKGHVAFVEAVFPDDTIQISEANWPEDGIYHERILTDDEWKGLRPHFIIV